MGIQVGYWELMLRKLLLHSVFLLNFLLCLISRAFDTVGLVDYDGFHWPEPPAQAHQPPEFPFVSAMLIQELLPTIRFENLLAGDAEAEHRPVADACAVCLYEFEPPEEVRQLSNCLHVFHRCCLDRWMEDDQRTCPLCRTPIIPEDMQEPFNLRKWASAGVPDSDSATAPPL